MINQVPMYFSVRLETTRSQLFIVMSHIGIKARYLFKLIPHKAFSLSNNLRMNLEHSQSFQSLLHSRCISQLLQHQINKHLYLTTSPGPAEFCILSSTGKASKLVQNSLVIQLYSTWHSVPRWFCISCISGSMAQQQQQPPQVDPQLSSPTEEELRDYRLGMERATAHFHEQVQATGKQAYTDLIHTLKITSCKLITDLVDAEEDKVLQSICRTDGHHFHDWFHHSCKGQYVQDP